ncbi:MAG TPA: hypothetical protein VGG04_11185 [Candidatus Sulfotelmatobacter sp.]|jgi:hypothetical protein
MKRIVTVVIGATLAICLCFGQSATSAAAQSAPAAVGHGAFPVKISKTLDSSKLKEGDAVEVETAGSFKLPDGTLVPKGSKLEGHVTAAKARSKGDSNSELTLAFEKLNIVNGKQLSIKGSVQAVFPPAEEPEGPNMATAGTSQGGSAGGGGSPGSAPMNPGGIGLTNTKNGSNMQSSSAQPVMDPKSVGVQGMHDLDLNDGVLMSKGKNVKLGVDVRMIVRAEIF